MTTILDDAAVRADQFRRSYDSQTEEFRHLNADLQRYLDEIRTIDHDNCELQDSIEQHRTSYVATLEEHLTRLPDDFREQSHILTDAHIERYRSKSRARRFTSERDELKRRIQFVASNEKEQGKRLRLLEKHDRLVSSEFLKLKDQIQTLKVALETEKQQHRQAVDKFDGLQLKFEKICIDRSTAEVGRRARHFTGTLVSSSSKFRRSKKKFN